MPRPTKPRIIDFIPENRYFIPLGVPKCSMETVVLKLEELEAMRLKDIENLSQEECAERMNVSRQTFQLIIDEARKKVAIAFTNGKAISIEGGNYTLNICKYQCGNCETVFTETYEKEAGECPNCGSRDTRCMNHGSFCMKRCRKKGCL
ncbi:MAG TPA: DUF134 domain-containing protein [Clostridia bacterium]|nr:DUF134 domain-containing protein [Clostridia bacterium]